MQKSCTPEVINSKSAKSVVLLSISLLLIVLFIGPFLKKKTLLRRGVSTIYAIDQSFNSVNLYFTAKYLNIFNVLVSVFVILKTKINKYIHQIIFVH